MAAAKVRARSIGGPFPSTKVSTAAPNARSRALPAFASRSSRVAARRASAFRAAGRSSVPRSNWLWVNASPQ
jgi:hypothetical protein